MRNRVLTVVAVLALLTTGLVLRLPNPDAEAQVLPIITIDIDVMGSPIATDVNYSISPEIAGCSSQNNTATPGTGTMLQPAIATATTGPLRFNAADFTTTPVFGDVQTFAFDMTGLHLFAGTTHDNPEFDSIEYSVSGALSGTPSGFASFGLKREIVLLDFYIGQSSALDFVIDAGADLTDGLQISELVGSDPVFVLNARELDTGRYHPPLVELSSDGTGRIQNSNNEGGINPATNMVVDVDFGDEYITDLSFDPTTMTVADTVPCRYTVSFDEVPGYQLGQPVFDNVRAGDTLRFTYIEDGYDPCAGLTVTIDMNTNGGDGTGTPGDDVILGTPGDDVIDAGAGDDVVCAGDGDDEVQGGSEADLIHGGPGNDRLFGSQGFDTILGGEGDDTIHGNRGNDELFGQDGADRIFGYSQPDLIDGGPGQDRLHGNSGDDVVIGGADDDFVFGYADDDRLFGGPGDDVLRGNRNDDTLFGNDGADDLFGSDGLDTGFGGDGNDMLEGNSRADTLLGGDGQDDIDGGIGSDVCDGGLREDTVTRCEIREDGL